MNNDVEKGVTKPAKDPKAAAKEEEDERFWNVILGLLLFLVCLMLYNELLRHYNHRQQVFWDEHYLAAVRGDPTDWKFGWRLEDLEQRIATQKEVLQAETTALDKASPGLLGRIASHTWHYQRPQQQQQAGIAGLGEAATLEDPTRRRLAAYLFKRVEDDSAMVTMSCEARPQYLLRVGPDDFRDVPTDRCQVFSARASTADPPPSSLSSSSSATTKASWLDGVGPHAVWQVVELGSGAVGLRSLSSGKYLKVVPPNPDDWNSPWKVQVVSSLPGLAERFQLKEGGKLFSELMHGYLQCSGGGLSEMLKGYPGETLYDEESEAYRFNLTRVHPHALARARTLRTASDHVAALQQKQVQAFLSLQAATAASSSRGSSGSGSSKLSKRLAQAGRGPESRKAAAAAASGGGYRVALVVPMTSKGTDMGSVEQSPLWFNLFASFMESVDWKADPNEYTFYLGLDKGDPLYDTGDAWSELRDAFAKNTRRALSWLNVDNSTSAKVLSGGKLKLRLLDFTDTTGAPSQVVVGLVRKAYEEGNDYFFQVNDDTVMVSKGWAGSFIHALAANPVVPNLGVTGPVDTNNDRILTHAFTHRTHVEIFGGKFFPEAFKNWWSDDWISTVYGSLHTFRMYDVLVTHNVQSQKTGAFQRYDVDESAKFALSQELAKGFVTVNAWLSERKLPRLPLPSVCGYSPLMGYLYDGLMKTALASEL